MLKCTDAINTKPKKNIIWKQCVRFDLYLKKKTQKGSDIREMCYRLAHGSSFGYGKRTFFGALCT